MQLILPWSDPDAAAAPVVVFVRHRRARRYILRVLRDGTVRVTLPRWGVKREAHAFVDSSRAWIARQRELQQTIESQSRVWCDDTRVMIDGRETTLTLVDSQDGVLVLCDGAKVGSMSHGGNPRQLVEAWLRDRARRELPPLLFGLAAEHGIAVPRVSIRNQRSRWGACTPSGTITLNWRLMQTPPFVREYILLHELMHRREMNHSRRFWRLVAACCPRHAEARHWLRKEGKALWSDRD